MSQQVRKSCLREGLESTEIEFHGEITQLACELERETKACVTLTRLHKKVKHSSDRSGLMNPLSVRKHSACQPHFVRVDTEGPGI